MDAQNKTVRELTKPIKQAFLRAVDNVDYVDIRYGFIQNRVNIK